MALTIASILVLLPFYISFQGNECTCPATAVASNSSVIHLLPNRLANWAYIQVTPGRYTLEAVPIPRSDFVYAGPVLVAINNEPLDTPLDLFTLSGYNFTTGSSLRFSLINAFGQPARPTALRLTPINVTTPTPTTIQCVHSLLLLDTLVRDGISTSGDYTIVRIFAYTNGNTLTPEVRVVTNGSSVVALAPTYVPYNAANASVFQFSSTATWSVFSTLQYTVNNSGWSIGAVQLGRFCQPLPTPYAYIV